MVSDNVVGRAVVEIVPDLKKFGRETQQQVKTAMAPVKGSFEKPFKESNENIRKDYDKTTQHVAKKTSGLSRTIKGALAPAVAAFSVLGAVGIAKSSIQSFQDTAVEVIKLQRVAGGTAEEMSRLRFAAVQSGIAVPTLTKGVQLLSKNLVATEGNGKKTAAMTKLLGFNFQDANGKVKNMSDILPQVADRFKNMPNGPQKTALALKLFGRAGTEMLPFLNKGSAGIAELTKKSDELGNTMSGKNIAQLTAYRKQQREFAATMLGVRLAVGGVLLVALTKVQTLINGFLAQMRNGTGIGGAFKIALVGVSNAISGTVTFIREHLKLMKALLIVIGLVVLVTKAHTAAMAAQAAGGFVSALANYLKQIRLVQVAVKIWTAFQWLLNLALSANPLGIVIIAIAALVAGIIVAYKTSSKFREILQGVFKGIAAAARAFAPVVKAAIEVVIAVFNLWWKYYAQPILTRFMAMVKLVWATVQIMGRIITATFNNMKRPIVLALAFLTRIFLDWVGGLLAGAAKALGWVPGVGGKLKKASQAFNKFKDDTNAAMNKLKDQTITVTPTLTGPHLSAAGVRAWTAAATRGGGKIGVATGGPIKGPGTTTSDSIPAMLSTEEHVLSAREVVGMGGHGAVMKMRAAARAGRFGYAGGGSPAVNVRPNIPSARGRALFASEIANHSVRLVKPTAQALARQVALGLIASGIAASSGAGATTWTGGGDLVPHLFRGKKLNGRTIKMLLAAERVLGAVFHIIQGSYHPGYGPSGGTHDRGGVMDTNGPRGWNAAVSALRRVGFAAWHRTPAQGFPHHIHSVALGDPTASPQAKNQMAAFRRGGDGLGHGRNGGQIKSFDNGGPWPPNTLGWNGSGKTETVIPGGGAAVVNNYYFPHYVGDKDDLVKAIDELKRKRRI